MFANWDDLILFKNTKARLVRPASMGEQGFDTPQIPSKLSMMVNTCLNKFDGAHLLEF